MNDEAWYRQAFDAPYLEVYARRDALEAESATATLLEPLGLRGLRVLDLACGAGRWAFAVAARGARVVAVDLSAELLAEATRCLDLASDADPGAPVALREPGATRRDRVSLVRGDMRHVPFGAHVFDLVLSMFTSFGYFPREDDDLGVLREVHRVLRPGGRVVIDVFNAEKLRRELEAETERQAGSWHVKERRWLDAVENTVVKEVTLQDGPRVHTYREVVRLWDKPRLFAALQHAGFEVESSWGSYAGEPYAARRSPRLIVVAIRTPQTA